MFFMNLPIYGASKLSKILLFASLFEGATHRDCLNHRVNFLFQSFSQQHSKQNPYVLYESYILQELILDRNYCIDRNLCRLFTLISWIVTCHYLTALVGHGPPWGGPHESKILAEFACSYDRFLLSQSPDAKPGRHTANHYFYSVPMRRAAEALFL